MFQVRLERVLAFARERIAAAKAIEHTRTKLFTPSDGFDSVIEKRVLSYGMLDDLSDIALAVHGSP